MEGSGGGSSKTVRTGSREETNDWKTKFSPDVRRQVVNKILSSLNIPVSDPDARTQIVEVVQQFEENTFLNARTKDDYVNTITRRVSAVGHKSGHCTAGVSCSNPGKLPQNTVVAGGGQSINLENVCQASSEFAGDSFRQGIESNISANSQRDIPGTQLSQKVVHQQHQQQESQQFLKHKVHRSQNQALPTDSQQTPFTEQLGTAVFKQNQLVAHEDNQQLSPFWKSMPSSFQQPLGLQSNGSCLQQHYRMIGPKLKAVNLKSHEHSVNTFQVEDTSSQPKIRQRVQSVNKFHQLLDSPNQRTQEATTQRPETLAPMLAPQNVNYQQKVLPSQKSLAEVSCAPSPASLEPASASKQANMADLHDQAYQKFKSLKKEYLPLLTYFHNILNEKCQKFPMPEVVGKYKKKIIATEKFIKVLTTPRDNLVRFSMEKLESFQQTLKLFLNSFKQKNSVSVQPPGGPSRTFQLQQHINGECQFHPVNLALTSKPVGLSPLSSPQQVVLSSQPNKMNSLCSGSLIELEQQNPPSSFNYAARPEGLDMAGKQHNKFFHDTRVKSFDAATKSPQQNYIISPFHQQKQLKYQMMKPQNVKQHIRPQLIQQHMRMANTQPVNTSGMLQHNPLISQPSEYSLQMQLPITRHFQSASPQMSQHSSTLVDQQNLPVPLSKVGTPLHSTSSSSITSSPSTPFTPFSIPADCKKQPSGSSPLIIPENSGHPQTIFALTAVDAGNELVTQSLPFALPGIAGSLSCTESGCPNENQLSSATKNPLERLIKAVQSLSPKALSASVSEIGSAMKIVDGIAETACGDSEADVDENLQGRNFSSQYGCSFEKMKRKLDTTSAMAPDALSFSLSKTDNLKQSTGQICDLDSSETSRIKRCRIEPSNALLDEIKSINQRLLETVLDLDSTEDIAAFDHGEGTIVRCVHNAVALSENFKMQYASQMSVLPLRLLVPASYPNSSPVILGGFTFDRSDESKVSIDLSEKTRSRFSLSLRKLSEPMSLAEMAMTWDDCTHTVLLECAQSVGGGSFSSRYGKWENCLTA